MNRKFKSKTMVWDEGDIPTCNYCGKDYDSAETIHESPFSGEVVCNSNECRMALLDQLIDWEDEVKEVES